MDVKSLISKLSQPCRKALETAAQLSVAQTHFAVEIEHFLIKLLESADTDFLRMLRYYDIDASDVTKELTQAADKFKRGNNRTPVLSPHLPMMFQEAWVVSSLHLGSASIRSGGIAQALLDNDALRSMIMESAPTLLKLPRERMREDMPELIRGSSDDKGSTMAGDSSQSAKPGSPDSKTPALDQYTEDLTAQARAGQIDPVQGRDSEIRQIIDILTRRRQNNPILTGDAGVGKTAVVEGFALRVAKGDVPPVLQHIAVRMLDLGLLQAGAGVRGEFENRLKSVIAEVKASPFPIIMFIDEAHTMIGAGAMAGQGDAANLLKPALARGEVRTIAATTWSEYKKYFEKDPALARRFQVIQVDEPGETAAMVMLRGAAANFEKHHKVRILDEAIHDAVTLSNRYISGRKLPDKAVSVLDTACARVAIGQTSTPPEVEAANRRIEQIEEETAMLRREQTLDRDHAERISRLGQELETAQQEQKLVQARWQEELAVFRAIRELQMKLDAAQGADGAGHEEMQKEISRLRDDLAKIQKNEPMVPLYVDAHVVASVVSGWTGIPMGKMMTDEIHAVLNLKDQMSRRVIGQMPALDAICRRIRTSRADLVDPGKPIGVFLLAGPSGVGKTETAVTLAELLYGGERNMVVINMSEYQEAHTVSGLKGAPPGYVGFGSGGVLTEAVRRDPYTVILLDEVEKAHPDVMDLFYQVFDKGSLEDGEGLVVNFKNTIILLTSNVGTDIIINACRDRKALPGADELVEKIRPDLLRYFRPSFLGRLVVVPYYPLGDEEIRLIVKLKLGKIQQRFNENHRAELTYDDELVALIADRCTEVDSGARNIDHILTNTLLPEISAEILERMAAAEAFRGVHVSVDQSGSFTYKFQGS